MYVHIRYVSNSLLDLIRMPETPIRDRKRDRSSEGETPKPENKVN